MFFEALVLALSFGDCAAAAGSECKTVTPSSYEQVVKSCTAAGEKVFYQHSKLEKVDYEEIICVLNRTYDPCRQSLLLLRDQELPHTVVRDASYGELSYTCLVYTYPPKKP